MKVVVLVRTRNEERNIGMFIGSYVDWVDEILVADGCSTDRTWGVINTLQENYDNIYVRSFSKVIATRDGTWRNPEGKHINFLLDWAVEREADWVIFDDCDCRPNYLVKESGREILETCKEDLVLITRLYLWKDTGKHFYRLAQPGRLGVWEPSLWAWRTQAGIRADDKADWDIALSPHIDSLSQKKLYPPYCLLHHPWPDEKEIQRKMDFYNHGFWSDGTPRRFEYPLHTGGPLEDLPEWARE